MPSNAPAAMPAAVNQPAGMDGMLLKLPTVAMDELLKVTLPVASTAGVYSGNQS